MPQTSRLLLWCTWQTWRHAGTTPSRHAFKPWQAYQKVGKQCLCQSFRRHRVKTVEKCTEAYMSEGYNYLSLILYLAPYFSFPPCVYLQVSNQRSLFYENHGPFTFFWNKFPIYRYCIGWCCLYPPLQSINSSKASKTKAFVVYSGEGVPHSPFQTGHPCTWTISCGYYSKGKFKQMNNRSHWHMENLSPTSWQERDANDWRGHLTSVNTNTK